MLGKLVKREWKSIYRMECLFLLMELMFGVPVWMLGIRFFSRDIADIRIEHYAELSDSFWKIQLFGVVDSLILVGNYIYLGFLFYRDMFTDKGYLFHTLPVTPRQLLTSKIIAGGTCFCILEIPQFIYKIIIVYYAAVGVDPTKKAPFWSFWNQYFARRNPRELVILAAVFILGALVYFALVSVLYGSLTCGHTFTLKADKWMMGIIIAVFSFYYTIYGVNAVVNDIVCIFVYPDTEYMEIFSVRVLLLNTIPEMIKLLIGAGAYFLSCYILERKLNLEG